MQLIGAFVMTRHVIFLLGIVAVESAVLAGRALYCRDPDTGKLHAVNSTWASSTFCGNYTCKLRVRNTAETQYSPLRQLNITSINNETGKIGNITVTIDQRTEPQIEDVIHKEGRKDSFSIIKDDKENKLESLAREVAKLNEVAQNENDPNRYLTDKEIKSISDMLQTVKKSDLDAIIDIYNLAQDIYNEMDKATTKGIIDETINDIAVENFHKLPKKSYWYDSLANKGRDMQYEGSHQIVSTTQPKRDVKTYFNGPLSNPDVVKMPYYYPISPFQRTASYIHQPQRESINIEKPKPCPTKQRNAQQYKDMQTAQNVIKPSYLLPYPFAYIHPYNYTDYSSNIYFNNPQAWNDYNRQRKYYPYYNAYIAQVPTIPNAVLTNPQSQEDVVGLEQKPLETDLLGKVLSKTKEKVIPDWKTEQLSKQVLDEVRANIDTSSILKMFPFRNKIKLEKVGKLIKLDELTRSRRFADTAPAPNKHLGKKETVKEETMKEAVPVYKVKEVTDDPTTEEGEYETYLIKTTCQTRAVLGYFRYGNMTQPYPECCPQLINNR